MSNLTIRMAERADYHMISELCLREDWMSYARNDFGLALDNSIAIVGVIGKSLVAYARVLTDGYITVFICELIVSKEYRGRGFGRRLVDFIHGLYPKTRTDLISEADGFYEVVGFRKVGTGFRKTHG